MNKSYDVHFCLVSDQAAANLLPVLDESFKPKQVVLLTSKQMADKAKYLESVLKIRNIEVCIYELSDIFSFHKLEEDILNIVSEYEDKNIILNVTGGTKLLAIAVQNIFITCKKPVFYLDTKLNRIIFLTRDENNNLRDDYHLCTKINLSSYLDAYGNQYLSSQSRNAHHPNSPEMVFAEKFIQQYNRYESVIPLLNKYAGLAQKIKKVHIDNNDMKFSSFMDLIKDLAKNNMISLTGNCIEFKSEKIRSFFNGGWLEEYVYQKLKNIKKIQDIDLSVEVGTSKYNKGNDKSEINKGNKNEFDVVFIANNTMNIIECKTSRMQDDKQYGDKPESYLYKLEALKNYGGLFTEKYLVSYFPVSNAVANRAKELKVKIIQTREIQQLKSIFEKKYE